MNRGNISSAVRIVGLLILAFSAITVHADDHRKKPVKWRVSGIIIGAASPFTTAAYFPRPLVEGELVEMTFTIDPNAAGFVTGTYATYDAAITSVKVAGSDWSIKLRSPLGRGAMIITDDDPDYGDSLGMIASTPLVPTQTWFSVDLSLSNPGGPNPGMGPWAPFTSLALPKAPPSLGLLPNTVFYIQARRDQPGQQFDGAAFYGQILWMTATRCDD